MENPDRSNYDEAAQQPSTRKRRRIPYTPASMVLSSDQVDPDEPEIIDPEAEVTEEDLILLGDPDLDQDGGEDELLGTNQYLDDTDFDDDPLNEESGRFAGSGSDLDVPDDELDAVGFDMQQADEGNDYFGALDDEEPLEDDEAKDLF